MDQEEPQHEKIRFRRDEITDLGTFPSACTVPPLGRARIGRGFRILARVVAGFSALVLLAAAAVYVLGASGIGTERLRAAAEAAIEKLAGFDVDVAVGPARLTLDGSSFIALQVSDVSLKTAGGKPIADAGRVRFGIRLIPLLSGEVRLTSARISDAHFMPAAMPSTGGDWTASLRNADGLVDPDKVVAAVFANVNHALDAVREDSIRQVDLRNVEFVLSDTSPVKRVTVANATVLQTGPGSMQASYDADVDGRALTIAASAARDTATGRVTALDANVSLAADAGAGTGGKLGAVTLKLTGVEGAAETKSRLTASLSLAGSVLDLGSRGQLPADVDANATLVAGANKIDVTRLLLKTGRSTFDFAGSIGPKPATAGEEPAYRYDLTSDGSKLSPSESPEPALDFVARIAGVYQPKSNKLIAEKIGVRSGSSSEVLGTASVTFIDNGPPGISLSLNIHDMPVSHVKQLWPWFSARNARLWVLSNLFGGRVVDATLQFQVVPGRLGNGVPLSADEVFGRFQVEGSRFDTAGRIPPIRDAVGVVSFRGNDVDIALSSGSVYMASGRTVAASNGTLTVKQANHSPVIGALDIDVAGEAPAIAELASYEPINAMRHVGLSPEDLTGTVTGHVKADIPLTSGVDTSKLNWLVTLDYKDLSLAKPFEDQTVTEADGSITVEPKQAVISAKARLNGIPAELDIVEPLADDGPPPSRKVELVLDDKTRATAMPGLSPLLSGTIKVAIDKSDGDEQNVSADLTSARLDIPWAGWSKGAGVPAKVTFAMTKSGGTTTLSDFDLDGKSFSIDGDVTLVNGALSSARFSKVALNRGDDVAVTVKRSGKGYAVDVSGEALDARSLIKQFTSDVDTATKTTGTDAISVDADVGSLTGFHDEVLSNLKLNYSAAGSRVNGLEVSATASSGAAITIRNTTADSRRALSMKSADAGAILRFLNVYEHMEGGSITLSMAGTSDGPMKGQVDATNFFVVNEPKLASIVSTTPAGDTRSLNQAVKADIDTSRVKFERGYAEIDKGAGYLKLANGVLRGERIGTTFQGTLYDQNNNMDMTGTFMPVYGLNRIFGELPLFGPLLGNGRDRGLIGVTFRLRGNANKPSLDINPLSVIAPGIFRSIFEYR
ncbi:YhdP family protein [Mesorhizobium abyssinicae]|uniref:YhdP family protein n=1 Tax=Mesorhizobium abyssinicae TaxID=1209958 RepID=UPI00339705F6